MTKKQSTPKKANNNKSTKAQSALKPAEKFSWTVPAFRVRRSYWWWVVYVWLLLSLSILCTAFQSWLQLLVVVLVLAIVFILNARKSPAVKVQFRSQDFTIEYIGNRWSKEAIKLSEYKAFTVLELTGNRRNPTQRFLVLRPKKLLGMSGYIQLPEGIDEVIAIAEQLESVMPYEEGGMFVAVEWILMQAARVVGIR